MEQGTFFAWSIGLSAFTLLVTVIGWGSTYRTQAKLLDRQINLPRNLKILEEIVDQVSRIFELTHTLREMRKNKDLEEYKLYKAEFMVRFRRSISWKHYIEINFGNEETSKRFQEFFSDAYSLSNQLDIDPAIWKKFANDYTELTKQIIELEKLQ